MSVFLCISIKESWRSKDNGVISGGQERNKCRGSRIMGLSAGSVGKAVHRSLSILFKNELADWPSCQAPMIVISGLAFVRNVTSNN